MSVNKIMGSVLPAKCVAPAGGLLPQLLFSKKHKPPCSTPEWCSWWGNGSVSVWLGKVAECCQTELTCLCITCWGLISCCRTHYVKRISTIRWSKYSSWSESVHVNQMGELWGHISATEIMTNGKLHSHNKFWFEFQQIWAVSRFNSINRMSVLN